MGRSSRALWTEHLRHAVDKNGGVTAASRTNGTAPPPVGERFVGFILGIDPSLRGTGLAVIEARGDRTFALEATETIRNRPERSVAECLVAISERTAAFLERYPVQHVALEKTIGARNVKVALLLGSARGAAIAAAATNGRAVFEYAPLRMKQAVCGFGRASKEQVAAQAVALLACKPFPSLDESDAAAIALCHAFTWRG